MQDLHLVGFTKDHRHLIFSTRKDAKSGGYVVPVDDDLVEAVDEVVSHRAENPDDTNDQVDEAPPSPPRVESQLSVREVQARLRAGDAADQIARDAGVDAEWVERFAQPIRAEQRRVVERALTVPFTRPRAGASSVPLRRAIAAAMAERDVDFTAEGFEAAWSARLVGGDDWVVAFEFPNRGRRRVLEWDFDIASGKLTTTDRFASQLAFVESESDLPPVEATVGAEASRVGSQMSRGPLTSGGLARPGSGRVTEPSPSAASLPPLVRPPMAPEGRQPDPHEAVSHSEPPRDRPPPSAPTSGPVAEMPNPRPTPEPRMPKPRDPGRRMTEPERSAPEQASPGRSVFPDPPAEPSQPSRRQPLPEPTPPRRPPAAPTSDVGRPAPAPAPVDRSRQRPVPPEDRPRQPMATTGVDRPQTAPVPPRRPAPVAAPTNATRTHTRRPVPEIAPRMTVTVDPDARDSDARDSGAVDPADAAAQRRGSLIEDEHALDDAVPSHPPGRGESVIILRAVDDPAEPDGDRPEADGIEDDLDFEDSAPEDATSDEVLDDEVDEDADPVEADSDDWDDGYEEFDADTIDDVDDYDEGYYDEEDAYADDDVDDDADLDELEPVGHLRSDDDDEIDVEDEAEQADDEASAGTEFVEVAPIEPAARGDVEDVEDVDEETGVDADTRPRPVRATVRRSDDTGTARRRRLVARRDAGDEAPDDERETDDDTDDTGRESSVQFRPGSATQAGSGRSAVSPNGRDEAPEAAEDASGDDSATDGDNADDDTTGPSDPPPRPRRRRRRTEPLRAR